MEPGEVFSLKLKELKANIGSQLEYGAIIEDGEILKLIVQGKTFMDGVSARLVDIGEHMVLLSASDYIQTQSFLYFSKDEFSVIVKINETVKKESIFVPIWNKQNLTLREAAEYSNIGINRIEALLKKPNCPFVLQVGNKRLVKRRLFDEFIESVNMI